MMAKIMKTLNIILVNIISNYYLLPIYIIVFTIVPVLNCKEKELPFWITLNIGLGISSILLTQLKRIKNT
jgi:hypothetical protein